MEYKIKPWDHQLKAIHRAQGQRDMAILFETGTGKTGTLINILRQHYAREKRLMRTLILGPPITVKNWQNEFRMHSKIPDQDVVALVGSGKKRVQTFLDAATTSSGTLTRGRIFVTNYEALEMPELFKLFTDYNFEIIGFDESHRLKNPKGKRAQLAVLLADQANHRYILTATMILNSPMDVFNQYRILDKGETFGVNFYEFRGRYFEDLNKGMPSHMYFPKWIARQEKFQELNRRIYCKAVRALKKDCLDLPPLVRTRISVELGKDQRRLYEEMKRDYITFIQQQEMSDKPRAVVAQMALTKSLRLLQIVSGFVKTETGEEVPLKDNPRRDALEELLSDLTPENKVIVWSTFHENYRQIKDVCRGLKVKFTELHGGISANEKNKAIETFREADDCRVIVASQAAGGIGINLIESPVSIFYSRGYSLEHDIQAEARNYRGGSERHTKVTRLDLVAENTIDELVIEVLAAKQNVAETILDWSKKL